MNTPDSIDCLYRCSSVPADEEPDPLPRPLTPCQLKVVKLIVSDHSNKQIAAVLHRSIKTVEKHRQTVYRKCNVHSVVGMVTYAIKNNLVELKEPQSTTPVPEQQMLDITAPKLGVDVCVREDGKIIWVNVDGVCALRVCRIPCLFLDVPIPIKTHYCQQGKCPNCE